MTGRNQAIKPEVRAAGAQNSWNFCLSRNKLDVFKDSSQGGREAGRGVPARQAGRSHHAEHCQPREDETRLLWGFK